MEEAKNKVKRMINEILDILAQQIPADRGSEMNKTISEITRKGAEFQASIENLFKEPQLLKNNDIKIIEVVNSKIEKQ